MYMLYVMGGGGSYARAWPLAASASRSSTSARSLSFISTSRGSRAYRSFVCCMRGV